MMRCCFLVKQTWLKPKMVRVSERAKYPYGRYAHASALVGSKVYIFGGHRAQKPSFLLNDLACMDMSTFNSH